MAGQARPDHPLISVVVPVYNEEACIDEMVGRIRAVFAKIDCDYQLIFVNDGSTDATLDRLTTAAASAPALYASPVLRAIQAPA